MYFSATSSPSSSPQISSPSTPGTELNVLFENDTHLPLVDEYVLVTGGLGFIGSHASVELMKAGYNVLIVDNLSNSFRDVFDRILAIVTAHFDTHGGQCPKAAFHQMSYQDIPAMRALLEEHRSDDLLDQRPKNQIIGTIHFASFKAVEESIRQPLKYYRNNINGLVDMMSLLHEYEVKTFIFSSSAAVYGSLADGGQRLREEQCVHQVESYLDGNGVEVRSLPGSTGITSPYGRTKYFGEAILSDLATSDPSWNIVSLRYFNPIGCDASGLLGEDPKGTPSNLLPIVVKVLTGQRKELLVYGTDWDTHDGSAVRDFIHVSDLARGHIAAFTAARNRSFDCGYRAFNIGTGTGHSVLEVVTAMESASGQSVPVLYTGRRAGDVKSSVAATDRAAQELGWRSKETLSDACKDLWNYLTLNKIWLSAVPGHEIKG